MYGAGLGVYSVRCRGGRTWACGMEYIICGPADVCGVYCRGWKLQRVREGERVYDCTVEGGGECERERKRKCLSERW